MEISEIYKNSQSHRIISLDKSRGMLSHAYMLECSDKFVVDQFGLLMAQEIYCSDNNSVCGICNNCQKVLHGNMVDLKVYPKEKNIMVDDVVEIVSDSIQRPMDAIYKVYILNNFDEATTQAQNKILKTLEEPPQNVIFILTCANSSAVLPTIISRVKTITEPLLNTDIVTSFLKDKGVKDPESVAMVSGNKIYSALKIAGGNAGKIVDLAIETLLYLRSSSDVLKFSSRIVSLKKDFVYFVDTLINIIRDVSVAECLSFVTLKNRSKEIVALSKAFSKNALLEISAKLCEIYKKLEFNCNLVGVVDQMLLDILEVKFLCQK
jgi:DNA polymerase-3 subunit delta'